MSQQHIYFDLDGTLTDPFEGISKSIVYALESLGAPIPDGEVLAQYIGPPLLDTFSELIDSDSAPRALTLYRERFAAIGWRENVPYEGIHSTLDTLKKSSARLFVATTKPWVFAEKIVTHFGMREFFTGVYGSELDGTRTDKTELLAFALQHNPGWLRATMVGDRKHDMIGACNNGMGALGVSYGYGSVDELHQAGAQRVVATPTEITELLL